MKKMIISLVMASIFSLVLVGCGKDAAAESAPETKVEEEQTVIAESTEESSEAAKLSEIQTDVSSPIGEDISEEPEIVEESEEIIEEKSEETSDDFSNYDYDDPSTVDYRAFCSGDLFEIDDYCVALGYDVALHQDNLPDLCYYNIERNGVKYSVANENYTMIVQYQDYEEGYIYTALMDWPTSAEKDMVVRSINHKSHDMSSKWVEEIAAALKYVATTDNFDLDSIPYSDYWVRIDEGMGVYDGNGTFYVPDYEYRTNVSQYEIKK